MIGLFIKYFILCLLIYYGIRFLTKVSFYVQLFRKANSPEARQRYEKVFRDMYGNTNNTNNPYNSNKQAPPIATQKQTANEDYIDFEEVK